MTDTAMALLLQAVKIRLGVTGDFQDTLITGYVLDTIEYMVSAGVDRETAESVSSAGVIARGVSDLWNYSAGDVKFSDFFTQRVLQMRAENETEDE